MERETPKELVVIGEEESVALGGLVTLVVEDNDSMEKAAAGVSLVRGFLKRIKEVQRKYVKPLKDHAKMIDGDAKKAAQPFKDAEAYLVAQLTSYRGKIAEEKRADEERIRKEEEKRRKVLGVRIRPEATAAELAPTVEAAPEKVKTETGTINFRSVPKWELVNIAAVPREFLMVDRAKVTAAVKIDDDGKVPTIPGIRTWTEETPWGTR